MNTSNKIRELIKTAPGGAITSKRISELGLHRSNLWRFVNKAMKQYAASTIPS